MPESRQQSSLLKTLGNLSGVHEEVKGAEVQYGNIQLPEGIEGGIAQLTEIKFDKFAEGANIGKPYVLAVGIVQTPVHFGGVKCKGLRTQFGPEPLCNTPTSTGKRKTLKDHYGHFLNMLKGFDPDTFCSIEYEELEEHINALVDAQPYFFFRTWKGKKQKLEKKGNRYFVGKRAYPTEQAAKDDNPYLDSEPRVNHEWCGVTEFDPSLAAGNEEIAQDDSADETETEEAPPPSNRLKSKTGPAAAQSRSQGNGQTRGPVSTKNKGKVPPEPEEEAPASNVDMGDIDSLVDRATLDDEEAQDQLTDMALEAGISQEDVDQAAGWQEVADMVLQVQSDQGKEPKEDDSEEPPEPEEDGPEPASFAKGDIVRYKPLDPATKKPAKKAVQCKVISVNEKARTARLKNLTTGKDVTLPDGKTPLSVSFDALEAD